MTDDVKKDIDKKIHIGIWIAILGGIFFLVGITLLMWGVYKGYLKSEISDDDKASSSKYLKVGGIVGGISILPLIAGLIARRKGY